MANRYVRAAGGNYSVAATWASTSGGTDSVAVPTSADDVFLDANSGQLTIDATAVAKSFNCTGYTGTLTHNAFNLIVSGSVTLVAAMTYTPIFGSSFISMSGNCSITTAGKLQSFIQHTTSGTLTLQDNLTFGTSKFCVLVESQTCNMNGKTISGDSTINRLFVQTGTIGTSGTFILNGGTFANADFRDITLSVAADLSAITGGSGDCGGNTNITFTSAADQHWIAATGGSWSNSAKWTSRIPLPQDNVYFDNAFSASQTVTVDMRRIGKSIDWTGATGSPTFNINSAPNTIYGSLTLISAMTLTTGQTPVFEGRGSFTLTSAGKSFASITQSMFGGTLTLQDSLTMTGTFTLNNGTLNDGGFSLSMGSFSSSNSVTRTITKSGTWSLTSTGTVWDTSTTTGLTLTDTGTTSITDTSASSKTFAGGGKTYNNISITGGGSGAVIFTGANTFNRIQVTGGTKTITLPGSTTTTLISGGGLGNGTNVITFNASAGSATLSKSTGTLNWDYVNLTNIPSTGGAGFFAGDNSTNGGGNTGWLFRGNHQNNFAGDPHCKALWSMESGALTTDFISSNTLTNNNTVTANTTTFREKLASGNFVAASSQAFNITDANLVSGFPTKSGETNFTFSIAFWVLFTSFASSGSRRALVSKFESGTPLRCFRLSAHNNAGTNIARMTLGFNAGNTQEDIDHGSTLSTATWYHMTETYNNADKTYQIMLRDTNGAVVGVDKTGTATLDANKLSITTADLTIGCNGNTRTNFQDGLIDEIAVFDDILTAQEATQISLGTYGIYTHLEGGVRGLERGLYGRF